MPAATIITALSSILNVSDFAILPGSQPTACAASSTVALDVSNSSTRASMPCAAKYAFTRSIAIVFPSGYSKYSAAASAVSLRVMRMMPFSRVVLQPLDITTITIWLSGST